MVLETITLASKAWLSMKRESCPLLFKFTYDRLTGVVCTRPVYMGKVVSVPMCNGTEQRNENAASSPPVLKRMKNWGCEHQMTPGKLGGDTSEIFRGEVSGLATLVSTCIHLCRKKSWCPLFSPTYLSIHSPSHLPFYCKPKYFSDLTIIASYNSDSKKTLYFWQLSMLYISSKEIAKNSRLLLKILLIWAKRYNILSAKIFWFTVFSVPPTYALKTR